MGEQEYEGNGMDSDKAGEIMCFGGAGYGRYVWGLLIGAVVWFSNNACGTSVVVGVQQTHMWLLPSPPARHARVRHVP